MKLQIIDENTYKEFALKSPYISIYQLPEWGKLKETNGWHSHLVGLYDNKVLKGVTLLLEKPTPVKKSLYYAPRGYLLDVFDFELLKVFHEEVIKYIKAHNGFMLKVDPNVIYALRDSEGNIKENVGEKAYQNFKKLGFKHLGFNENFEGLQPRYLCRFKLQDTYDQTFDTFTKSTKRNITKTIDEGVCVRSISLDEMDLFVSLLEDTATTKDFIIRPASYYKKMYELMSDYLTLYIAYIDTSKYYQSISINLASSKKELANLEKQMAKINVGDKIKKHKSDLESKIAKLEVKLKEAKGLKDSYDKINIGALMSVFIGNEAITFMSGTAASYKNFSPKYAFYNEHIKDALKKNKEYVNFYGISGNLDKEGPYYGIYEIKKGFNPEIVELIGEFDYIINPFTYHLYKLALKLYKLKKRIMK